MERSVMQGGFHLQAETFGGPWADLQDPTSRELKKKIVSAVKTLSIDGKQSCLVQYWAATNAGKSHLLATTDQPFGIYGSDQGLELYRKACLHHKLYVHREGKISFGLPGHAFKDRTPHQTQHVHNYPEDQRPSCEDKAIFSEKWGSFAVPVILANECIGVLEFVDTEPTHTYDGDINEVNRALKCAGFESFNVRDTQKDTHIPNKRERKTNSSMYEHYNVLVPYFGLSKAKAMEKIDHKFFPKKQTETTREATHIPDYSAGKAKKVKKEFEEGNRLECQDHETPYLDALNHFVVDNDYNFPGLEIPDWSKSRADQTLCDETSSLGILNNAGDLNSGWDIDLDDMDLDDIDLDHVLNHLLDQEIHDLSDTHTDQTILCEGTNSFGILNDASCDFNSSWDKGVNERPYEPITTTNTSRSGIHQSPITGFKQESCEMGDEFFSPDMFKDF
ncbi:RWP-RK domain-containing protein [Artemisia annua]|uniref:RWP-RK domain-containing protein n=1 Tax=Artemisia annua TaxID=35608 RepID=A0A2U1PMS5_ARTAN|nr:RWP-RK domain-containing protein [Artemisia annua]